MLQAKPSTSPLPYVLARRGPPRRVTFTSVGALVGLAVFIGWALLPSLNEGGVAGLKLAELLLDAPRDQHVFGFQAFIVAGITTSVSAFAALFAAVGAVAGASVGLLTGSTGGR
jgi:hypothetical protein